MEEEGGFHTEAMNVYENTIYGMICRTRNLEGGSEKKRRRNEEGRGYEEWSSTTCGTGGGGGFRTIGVA